MNDEGWAGPSGAPRRPRRRSGEGPQGAHTKVNMF